MNGVAVFEIVEETAGEDEIEIAGKAAGHQDRIPANEVAARSDWLQHGRGLIERVMIGVVEPNLAGEVSQMRRDELEVGDASASQREDAALARTSHHRGQQPPRLVLDFV